MASARWFGIVAMALAALIVAGCAATRSSDAIEGARRMLYDDSLRHCAEAEFAAADALLEQAERAQNAGDHREAERLAEIARVQAERAWEIAESRRVECEEELAAAERARLEAERARLEEEQARQREETPFEELQVDHDFEDIYFDFDQYSLSQDALRILEGHITFLRRNPEVKVTIEGHTDQHGSEEYNLALGERRGRAVRDHMVNQGLDISRISVVSYGKLMLRGDDDHSRRASFHVY